LKVLKYLLFQIQKGLRPELRDVAPTISYILNIPALLDSDGKVIQYSRKYSISIIINNVIDDFLFLINFDLMPYSFVLGKILALSI